ncbi:hypothetical protein J6Y73_05240 [bacterium]|nr:hypothetical protein [bacterium]
MIIERIDKDYDKRIRFDGIILGLALLFTLLSDTFLLHLDNYYEIGVTSFLVVQVLYLFRMFYSLGLNRKRLKITLMIRGCAFILIMLGLIIFNSFSYLYLITGLYFINLVMNFIDSLIFLISYRGEDRFKSIFVFTIGLLLFIGCDINVGLSNLIGVGSNIIWIFYLPSQVLISLSGTRLFNMTLGGKVINERKQ